MPHPKIRLACRVIIDKSSSPAWDKYIYEDTYREYLMQQQLYNTTHPPVHTFRELLSINPKADKLNFLTGMAANSYVEQLKGNFYRVQDFLGTSFFPFINYRLDIVNTDITDISKHKVGITLFSPLFTYLGMVNNCYLVSAETADKAGYETVMFPVQPQLSICYYEDPQFNDLEKSQ